MDEPEIFNGCFHEWSSGFLLLLYRSLVVNFISSAILSLSFPMDEAYTQKRVTALFVFWNVLDTKADTFSTEVLHVYVRILKIEIKKS